MLHSISSCQISHPRSLGIPVAPHSWQHGMVLALCSAAIPGLHRGSPAAAKPPGQRRAWAPGMSASDLVQSTLMHGSCCSLAREHCPGEHKAASRMTSPQPPDPRCVLWVVAGDCAHKSSCALGNLLSCWRSQCSSPQPEPRRVHDFTHLSKNGPSLGAHFPPADTPKRLSFLQRRSPFQVQRVGEGKEGKLE